LTKDGISTTFRRDECRAAHNRAGTARNLHRETGSRHPASNSTDLVPHEALPGPPKSVMSFSRNDSSTAFFSTG